MRFFEKAAEDKVEFKDYQKIVSDKLKNSPGLVVFHGLGSGKTLTAINAVENLGMPATVVTPASLRTNFSKEVDKAHANPKHFDITSYERFSKDKETPKGGVLVLDEAQRARNISSKTTKKLIAKRPYYNKALLLSGTPIQNYPYESAPLIDIAANKRVLPLAPKAFNDLYINKRPVNPSIISRLFRGAQTSYVSEPKNLDLYRSKVHGLVDYHKAKDEGNYPSKIEKDVIVPMDLEQQHLNDYFMQRLPKHLKYQVQNKLPVVKQDAGKLNSFISATRQLSNTTSRFINEPEHSPKFKAIIKRIEETNGPSIVYSNYLDSGVRPLSTLLDAKKISHGVYTGELNDTQKKDLVQKYNAGKFKALLISGAGSEGLDLKNTRSVHLVNPGWNDARLDQVVGRAVRYKSHESLPESQRNVTVYNYLSEYPKPKMNFIQRLGIFPPKRKTSSDEYLSALGAQKTKLNDSFLNILKEEGSK